MRYIREINGLQRMRTTHDIKPPKRRIPAYPIKEKHVSQDTAIRYDIYKKVVEMLNNNENGIKIECVLREEYPDYAQLIANLVNDQIKKRELQKSKKTEEKGEQR